MSNLIGLVIQIPPLEEEICQGPRSYDGYIYLPKLQQSGGIHKITCVLDGSALLGNSDGRTIRQTFT